MREIKSKVYSHLIGYVLSILLLLFMVGCKKSDVVIRNLTDTVVVIPPVTPPIIPTPIDTINYINRLEEFYEQGNPNITRRNRDYTFYYDNNKRITKVGIKNYSLVLFDTATCFLYYLGNAPKPYMVVSPNVQRSSINQPIYYDTTYFYYDFNNQIISDSSSQLVYDFATASYKKGPFKRYYYYPTSVLSVVEWFAPLTASGPLEMIRRDSLQHSSNHQITKLKTQFTPLRNPAGNYALGETFTYTNYVNPLSKLNISGTLFSLIYTSVNSEILGNENHKAVRNSNILPYYLDFWSPTIPSQFYLGGFTSNNFLISSQYDMFGIQIIPWTKRNSYPSQISVGASTALGDRFIYKYYYN